MRRMSIGVGLLTLPIPLVSWILNGDTVLALSLGVFVIFFPISFAWGWRGASLGQVELTRDGVYVKSKRNSFLYMWQDINDLSITTADKAVSGPNRVFVKLLGVNLDHRLVQLRLARRPRVNLLTENWGTRRWGIPGLTKRAVIEPEDVDGLAAGIREYLITHAGQAQK